TLKVTLLLQLIVPALVSAAVSVTDPPPSRLSTPLVAMFTGPPAVPPLQFIRPPLARVKSPEIVPPFKLRVPPLVMNKLPVTLPLQLKVPLTVAFPFKVAPEVRLVIVPPWKLVPKVSVPPTIVRLGITLLGNVKLPPVNWMAPGPLSVGAATKLKLPPLKLMTAPDAALNAPSMSPPEL